MSVAETAHGKVAGRRTGGLHVFRGIPFAAPPVAERRWQPPADPEPWAGVRRCTTPPPQSWQPVTPPTGPLAFSATRAPTRCSENCLYLNVWTPGLDDKKRPVLVWIHGGGFFSGFGASPMYEGASLAGRGDAVVVTINYRLGALGFLSLHEATGGRIPAAGNEGLLDEIKALEWVRDNIGAFGGDPRRVTVFGESAGGISVGALLTLAPASGLFRQAILQSGAGSIAQPAARAAEIATRLLHSLGLSGEAAVDDLLALDPARLVAAGTAVDAQIGGTMIFQPCIDGTLLADLPLNLVRGGAADGTTVMVGVTRDEWRLFTAMPGFKVHLDDDGLAEMLGARLRNPARVIAAYRGARAARGEATDANALFAAIETDRIFRIPAIRLAEALADRGGLAFEYLFTQKSPWGGGILGCPHSMDIGFVFGTHDRNRASAEFFGSGERADAFAACVQEAWLAFAADGDPRTNALAGWEPYNREARATALLGDAVSVANDPCGAERSVWDDIDIDAQAGSLTSPLTW